MSHILYITLQAGLGVADRRLRAAWRLGAVINIYQTKKSEILSETVLQKQL